MQPELKTLFREIRTISQAKWLILVLALLLAGCASPSPTPAMRPEFSPTLSSAAAQTPTATLTPTAPPSPTATPRPSRTPTPTHTPIPSKTPLPTLSVSPLTEHTWDSGPVLARIGSRDCVDACTGLIFSALPELVLYSDGTLLTYDQEQRGLLAGKLDRSEICSFLNAIEQTGFFEYDEEEYDRINSSHPRLAAVTWIEVNAWQTKQMYLHGLRDYVYYNDLPTDEIDPHHTLYNASHLFEELRSGALEYYAVDRLVIFIRRITEETYFEVIGDQGEWPLVSPSLEELLTRPATEHYSDFAVIVTGTEAAAIHAVFDFKAYSSTTMFHENNKDYAVAIRVLLPYETSGGRVSHPSEIPGPEIRVASSSFTCAPSDGLMPLPTKSD